MLNQMKNSAKLENEPFLAQGSKKIFYIIKLAKKLKMSE